MLVQTSSSRMTCALMAAADDLGIAKRHERSRWLTIEPRFASATRRRREKCKGSRAWDPARFLSVHAATQNTFDVQRHLTQQERTSFGIAMQTWREVVAAA